VYEMYACVFPGGEMYGRPLHDSVFLSLPPLYLFSAGLLAPLSAQTNFPVPVALVLRASCVMTMMSI
jgi:hypothetical protein